MTVFNYVIRLLCACAGASPIDSEDEDAVVLSERPAPAAPAQTPDPRQQAAAPVGAGPRSASAPAQTASHQQRGAADGAGPDPASSDPAQTVSQQRSTATISSAKLADSVPAQTTQRADSDEDADTWQFMTLPPSSKAAQQSPAQDAAPTNMPLRAPALQQPSLHGAGAAAEALQTGSTDLKPSSHEWEAELEPTDVAEGGRTAAAVIAAAAFAAAGVGLSLVGQSAAMHT